MPKFLVRTKGAKKWKTFYARTEREAVIKHLREKDEKQRIVKIKPPYHQVGSPKVVIRRLSRNLLK